jgi:hypothetical protein
VIRRLVAPPAAPAVARGPIRERTGKLWKTAVSRGRSAAHASGCGHESDAAVLRYLGIGCRGLEEVADGCAEVLGRFHNGEVAHAQ